MTGYIEHTPENANLMTALLGPIRPDHKTTVMIDGRARRINGRYIVGNVPDLDEHGDFQDDANGDLLTRRQRFRIPKNHPWRGKRP